MYRVVSAKNEKDKDVYIIATTFLDALIKGCVFKDIVVVNCDDKQDVVTFKNLRSFKSFAKTHDILGRYNIKDVVYFPIYSDDFYFYTRFFHSIKPEVELCKHSDVDTGLLLKEFDGRWFPVFNGSYFELPVHTLEQLITYGLELKLQPIKLEDDTLSIYTKDGKLYKFRLENYRDFKAKYARRMVMLGK